MGPVVGIVYVIWTEDCGIPKEYGAMLMLEFALRPLAWVPGCNRGGDDGIIALFTCIVSM